MPAALKGSCIDNIGDIASTDGFEDLFTALADFSADPGADTVLLEECCSTRRCLNVEAHVIEASHERQRLLLVLVCEGDKHCSVVLQLHSGCLQCLVHGARHLVIIAYGFPCGFHLGTQIGIETFNLVPGKYRHLDVMALFLFGIQIENPLLLETLAENDLSGDICQRPAGSFGEERHRAGGTWIDLDDVNALIPVHDKLDIVQSDDSDAEPQFFCVL